MKKLLVSTLLITSTLFAFGMHNKGNCGNFSKILQQYPIQTLSNKEKNALLHMREEEKLARDVYITLYKKWGFRVFNRISKAEQHHMDMVKLLLNRYKLPDNAANTENKIGVFNDKKVQELYNQLVAQGEKSGIEALKVGALIEDLDIYDLEKFMKESDNKDLLFIFKNLTKGSRNHMRAFISFLSRDKITYKPQYISKAEFNSIIDSRFERGMIR